MSSIKHISMKLNVLFTTVEFVNYFIDVRYEYEDDDKIYKKIIHR